MAESEVASVLKRSVNYDALDEKIMALAERGIICMSGEIVDGASSVFFISTSFMQMARPGKPIWIVMNTIGGSATECFALCDMMRAITKKGTAINILGVGEIASAGVALMQMGTRRYSFPLTRYLVHQVRGGHSGEDEEVSYDEERLEEKKKINRIFLGLISERTGKPVDEIVELAKKTDYWMDAQAAKEFGPYGLIDQIVDEYPFEI
ncbi:MAG: ATP-dependent Clp protease proteolytic subunit [Candidatus Yanofskybacteria bacterium]|nr:ATP-dependent Clp protease proteolytic subunit [Candidatus Yanofskybacteria bacterium]